MVNRISKRCSLGPMARPGKILSWQSMGRVGEIIARDGRVRKMARSAPYGHGTDRRVSVRRAKTFIVLEILVAGRHVEVRGHPHYEET